MVNESHRQCAVLACMCVCCLGGGERSTVQAVV